MPKITQASPDKGKDASDHSTTPFFSVQEKRSMLALFELFERLSSGSVGGSGRKSFAGAGLFRPALRFQP